MDLLSIATNLGTGSWLSAGIFLTLCIVAFVFVLSILVFVHEAGHFLAARWCGVKVDTFSIGFGPEIGGFDDRHGTRWRLAWIPLGGYVKFMDDENAASVPSQETIRNMSAEERAGSFHAKPLWQRAFVVAAGPLANFILAIVVFAGMYWLVGQQVTPAIVDEVQAGSVAEAAGFKPGDRIVEVEGVPVESFADMQRVVSVRADQKLKFVVLRKGQQLTIDATPRRHESKDRFGNVIRRGLLGVKRNPQATDWEYRKYDLLPAIGLAFKDTWFVVTTTMSYLKKVVVGEEKADQLSGPVGIALTAGQMASLGLPWLIHLIGLLSVGIGLVNLFPIPMLDGGHLMFYAIEAVRQRPLSERAQEIGFRVGLAFVLMLTVFVTVGDVRRILNIF
jgi:regulator of sigma E protease